MTIRRLRLIAALAAAWLLCQCGTPSPPVCHSLPRESRTDPQDDLAQARAAWQSIGRDRGGAGRDQALARYNAAVSRLFDRLHCGSGTFHQKAAAFGTTIDDSHTLGAGLHVEDLEALLPARRIATKNVGQRHTVDGLGVPVVGWDTTAEEGDRRWEFAPPTGIPLNLTAILRFPAGRPPQWDFLYPGKAGRVAVPGGKVVLAADWSAANAFYWQMSQLDDFDLAKALLPSRFSEETALYLSSPYDPNRIPLVLVHGLNSSPGTFKQLFNELNREPWFRQNYQVWFFSYPTGNNWLYSAARFREEMTKATRYVHSRGGSPNWDKMVVVGHSMGGVITHASLKHPEASLYDAFGVKPLDQLKVSTQTREAIRLLTMYEPLRPPARAIFLAAPHRGSPMADRVFSELLVKLIRLPKKLTIDLVDFTLSDLSSLTFKGHAANKGWFTSIGSLSPSYPAYDVLRRLPFRDHLVYHSIIGDRGRGDTPNSSDGIVPYWSSHLDGAASEAIVPYGHSLTAGPQCEDEIKRILKLHLAAQGQAVNSVRQTGSDRPPTAPGEPPLHRRPVQHDQRERGVEEGHHPAQ